MNKEYKIYYGEHESQFGVLRVPENKESNAVIVLIHGGFWQSKFDLELNDPIAEDLTKRGFVTWNIEYRRVGETGGGWTGTFNDVISAVNYLSVINESHPLDTSNVTVVGHSAGGHLALWLGSRIQASRKEDEGTFTELTVEIKKAISLAGVTDLRRMWKVHHQKGVKNHEANLLGGTPSEVDDRYKLSSPIELVPLKLNQVLIHGELDQNVPVDLSKSYYNYALEKGENVSLVILPDIEHFKIIDPTSTAWTSVLTFL